MRDCSFIRATPDGPVRGALGPHDSLMWHGIPYAAAPVGEFRWKAPQPVAPWTEILDARFKRNAAPQVLTYSDRPPGARREGEFIGTESCLHLSVWTPRSSPPPDGRPVMVWLHGGGNKSGDGADIDAGRLSVSENLVVVSITHRLGILGWFSHRALAGSDATANDRSGNFATLDQIAALRWVQEAIGAFGGDTGRVTIFGESSGGWNVRALVYSPLAKGLFHRAIIQSVGAYQTMSALHAENFIDDDPPGHPLSSSEIIGSLWMNEGRSPNIEGARLAIRAEPPEALAAWLRSIPVATLFAAARATRLRNARVGSSESVTPSASHRLPQMFRDGSVISDEIQSHVPVVVGMTRNEDRAFLSADPAFVMSLFGAPLIRDPARFTRLSDALGRLFWSFSIHDFADDLTRKGLSVFAYRFDWDDVVSQPGIDLRSVLGACHGIELPFLFGSIDSTRDVAAMRHLFDVESDDFAELSTAMMRYWAAFARTGDPGTARGLPRWPNWDGRRFLVLDGAAGDGIRIAEDSSGSAACVSALAKEMMAMDPHSRRTLRDDLYRYPNCRLNDKHYLTMDPNYDEAQPSRSAFA